MRNILDKLFENKKLAFWLPIILATFVYLLFLLFGTSENKNELLIAIPVAAVFGLFGTFLVFFIQVKNPMCPEWFLNLFELMAVVVFTTGSFASLIYFVISGFQYFNPATCATIVIYSSISWAHNKRAKIDN